jgi:hypothetical protein
MLEHGKSLRAGAIRALKAIFGELYPLFIFYALYAGVVYLYDALQPFTPLPVNLANLIEFATSPFSFVEATPPYSSSTVAGLYDNFLFVAVIMMFLAMYSLASSGRLKSYVSLPLVFGASVAGTYAVSAGVWVLSKQPSTGTSIIGFTTAVTVAFASGADLSVQLRLIFDGNRTLKEYAKAYVLLVVFGIASLIALGSYIFGNSSYLLHLAGGAVSGGVLVLLARRHRFPQGEPQHHGESHEHFTPHLLRAPSLFSDCTTSRPLIQAPVARPPAVVLRPPTP